MKKGFTVIEILIAMMILFVAIGFVNISIKTFNTYQRKSETYQNFYITALSLKDWISSQSLEKESYQGIMNGIEYKFNIIALVKRKNYVFNMELGSGNYGDNLITLYKVEMLLNDKIRTKKFEFLLTKQLNLVKHIVVQEGT